MITLELLHLLLCAVVLLFGIVVGSFLNVCIYRLPRDISVVHGFSACPGCDHRLLFWDLIPLFSFLGLRGRCRYCHAPISPQYPLVELANGLLWVGVFLRFGLTPEALAYGVIVSGLLVIIFTDLQQMIIPDSACVALALAGLLLLWRSSPALRTQRLIGMVCVSGVLLLIALLSGGRAMGGGDIKLMAALGLCLGWKLILLTTLLGAVLGSLAFVLLRHTRFSMGRQVPFGAFLALGGLVAVFFGPQLLHWYLGLFVVGHRHGEHGETILLHPGE